MRRELYSDIQSFVLIFVETVRKRTHIYIGSAILTRFLHDHWGHCEIFVCIYLKSDRAYLKIQIYYRTCSIWLVKSMQVRLLKKIMTKKAGTRLAGKTPACLILLVKKDIPRSVINKNGLSQIFT